MSRLMSRDNFSLVCLTTIVGSIPSLLRPAPNTAFNRKACYRNSKADTTTSHIGSWYNLSLLWYWAESVGRGKIYIIMWHHCTRHRGIIWGSFPCASNRFYIPCSPRTQGWPSWGTPLFKRPITPHAIFFPASARISSLALSAATMIPNCGLTVRGSTMLASTTCKFFIPFTAVFLFTQCPMRQLLE